MTLEPTRENIAYVIARLERAEKTGTLLAWRSAGRDARELLTAVRAAQVEPVLAPETYTSRGLPRRAASRARENGAVINYRVSSILVEFPNGSEVVAQPALGNTAISRHAGAAPGCKAPEGLTLEEILNNFADEQERA